MDRMKAFQILVGAAALFAVVWFFLYERHVSDQPSRTERLLARGWLLFRRVSCFVVAAFFALVGIALMFSTVDRSVSSRIGPVLLCLFIAGMAIWVGLYGGGVLRSMSDDRGVHQRRKKRYGWRW